MYSTTVHMLKTIRPERFNSYFADPPITFPPLDPLEYFPPYILLRQSKSQWRTEGVLGGSNPPPHSEIQKALKNRAKLNPTVKTVKNC